MTSLPIRESGKMQMDSVEFRFTAKQEGAILALLTCRTVAEAAKQAKVSERVLYKWLKQPEFRQGLEREKKKLREQAFDYLRATLGKAVKRLRELLDSPSESIRLKACQAVLDYNIKVAQTQELEERLKALEETLEQKNKGGFQ